ncbi:MAG: PEP-CTERM sorting domain-containing protein [Burkholderiaceae bacterium]|nr:PEP-CTERM sorting domain-containing protein [Burkholderiaceae bacterium]
MLRISALQIRCNRVFYRQPRPRRLAAAIAQGLLTAAMAAMAPVAMAAVTVTGPYYTVPNYVGPLNGPNLLLPTIGLNVQGSFAANAGSQVELSSFGVWGQGGNPAEALLDGFGTVMTLRSDGNNARLAIGQGTSDLGALTVSGGALLDGRADASSCQLGRRDCHAYMGNGAGSKGSLLVTGQGSEARFLSTFDLGNLNVNGGFGTAGAQTEVSVTVAAGARLRTQDVAAGGSYIGPDGNGLERSLTHLQVTGLGSHWMVEHNSINGNEAAASFANGSRATTTLKVLDHGSLLVYGKDGQNYGMRLGNGGSFSGEVSGGDSMLGITGDLDKGYLHIAEGGQATVAVKAGATLVGGRWNQVGMNGGSGTLQVQGAGSLAQFDRGSLNVGSGGTGSLLVAEGGVVSTRSLNVGSGQAGSGNVVIDGAGSVLRLSSTEGHRLAIGDWGEGRVTISGGALLDSAGYAADCNFKWCGAMIGHWAGGTGVLTVTGAGSEARFLSGFAVATAQVATQAADGWTAGLVGGSSHGRVEVLDGALLSTKEFGSGLWSWNSPGANGGERSFAEGLVSGAGSRWLVTGSVLEDHDARVNLASSPRSFADWQIRSGGVMLVQAPAGRNAGVDLGSGGQATFSVQGSGSLLQISGADARLVAGLNGGRGELTVSQGGMVQMLGSNASYLHLGESAGTGVLSLLSGGQLSGARSVNVGSGGTGSLLVDGTGSLLTLAHTTGNEGQLLVASSGRGDMTVSNGGAVTAFTLGVGNGWELDSQGSVTLDGSGSTLTLDGVDWHRLSINRGGVTVSGGAVLDAAGNAAACTGHWCGVFIANNAGDEGSLTVTGAGSKASFLSQMHIGQSYVTAPPATPYTLGHPGATSTAIVRVLDGGQIESEDVRIANGPSGSAATGSEGVLAQIRIQGAGSRWLVRPNPSSGASSFMSGLGSSAGNTLTDIQVLDGGELRMTATASTNAQLILGQNGGTQRLLISGAGAKLSYADTLNGGLWIGRSGATANLSVANGGAIEGVNRIQVGNTGAVASFNVSGPTSSITYGSSFADLFVGRAAVGVADISGGAQVQMHANNFSRITIGDNNGASMAAGQGSLTLRGAGTLVSMKSGVADNANTFSPTVNIGWSSNGVLAIRDGAALRIEGLAPTGPELFYEGAGVIAGNGWAAPSSGRIEVSGPGSKLETLGSNPFITVGDGAYGSGHLSISNGALVRTTLMGIADFGAAGTTQIDNATLRLEGAWRTSCCIGASLSVGSGAGSAANLTLNHGAQLLIGNDSGGERTNLSLGGIMGYSPGGTGIMSLAGGSQVSVSGSGGGGGQIVIGATSGGIGVVSVAGGSQMSASYVGVGAFNGADTGVGTLLVQDSSTVSADQIEIGAKGFVGGNGTIIGNVINRGVFSPGNSPGTLTIDGSFTAAAGSRLVLEVQSDGLGGFVTDHLMLAGAHAVDLTGLAIEFRFLGATDPNAFQASGGFDVDRFMSAADAALPDEAFSGVQFSASASQYTISNFSYTAGGGAVFQAQAVPEPATWAMWLLGMGALALLRRRGR